MKKNLFILLACALWSAGVAGQSNLSPVVRSHVQQIQAAKLVETQALPSGATLEIRETADGIRFKQVRPSETDRMRYEAKRNLNLKQAVNPNRAKAPKKAETKNMTFAESFEGYPGSDLSWLPDGWERRTNNPQFAGTRFTWHAINQLNSTYYPAVPDGEIYMAVDYNSEIQQNERMITPEFTPQAGDKFNFTVMGGPITLFDFYGYDPDKWVAEHGRPTSANCVWNFQVWFSVYDAEYDEWTDYERVYDYFDQWIDADLEEIYYYYPNLHVTPVHLDLDAYVGKKMKVQFRYYGNNGNTMFLDDVKVCKPYLTAEYHTPLPCFYMGMTEDWYTPAESVGFYPAGAPQNWTNLSGAEATKFEWTYENANHQMVKSNSRNLQVTYNHVAEQVGAMNAKNFYKSPTLTASADGFEGATFTHHTTDFKIGGKAYYLKDGKEHHTGASSYDPADKATVLYDDDLVPLTGTMNGENSAFWSNWYQTYYDFDPADYNYKVTGIYNAIYRTQKDFKLRGLWIQGIGDIAPDAKMSVTIHRLTADGAIDQVPVATARLNTADIQTYGFATEVGLDNYQHLTLPFVFADPVNITEYTYTEELNGEVTTLGTYFVRLNGLDDENVNYFAPLVNLIPSELSYGYVQVKQEVASTGTGVYHMNPLSYISTEMGNQYGSFYMTYDMAFDDAEDWGHLELPGESTEIDIDEGHIQYHEAGEELFDRMVRSAFYNRGAVYTELYICVGALEAGEDHERTNHIYIKMPNIQINSGKEVDLETSSVVECAFYNIMRGSYAYTGQTGRLIVKKNEEGYDVLVDAYDPDTKTRFGCLYTSASSQNWIDRNYVPTTPNEWSIGNNMEAHEITKVTINDYNAQCNKLTLESDTDPVVICMSEELFDGLMHGFSAIHNDHATDTLSIMVHNDLYSWYSTTHANENVTDEEANEGIVYGLGQGGNVSIIFDEDDNILLNFTLYQCTKYIQDDQKQFIKGHYEGPVTRDHSDAIRDIISDNKKAQRYNLSGQRVDNNYRGIILSNGKKFVRK